MKKNLQFLLIACFTFFSINLMAQMTHMNYDSHETLAKSITDKMKTELSLNSNQEARIKTLNENYTKRMHDLKMQYPNNRSELSRQVMDYSRNYDKDVRNILNENQYSTYISKKSTMQVDMDKIRNNNLNKNNNQMNKW